MAKFDFGAQFGAQSAGVVDTAGTVTSGAIDTQTFEGVGVLTITDAAFAADAGTAVFFEGDTDTFGDATEVEAHRVITNPDVSTADTLYKARVTPTKRYLFVQYTFTGTPAGKVATVGILGYADKYPVD